MAKKQYPVIVDAENKIIFPSAEQFISANPELGLPEQIKVEDGGDITINDIINTNGIHEQNVYTNEPSYSMKGWYLASAIENPYYLLGDITFDYFKEDPYANIFIVLLSDKKVSYEIAKNTSPTGSYDQDSTILQKLEIGDILTFKNDWNLINAIEITGIYGNRIEFKYILDNLNENYMPYMFDLQEYGDHILSASVRCFAKPDAGYVEFAGENATAVGGGSQISRGYLSTNVGGRRNNTCGDFSVSIGEDNIVEGKSSVAVGKQNTIKQEENISIGNINEIAANVRQGFIFGGNNTTNQENSVLVGRGLTLNRQNTSLTRTIIGRFNNPAEDGAVVIGTGQGPNDLYNGVIIDRASCTFRGNQEFEYYTTGDKFSSKHGIVSLGSNNSVVSAQNGTYMLGGGLTRDQQSDTNNKGTRTIVGLFNEDVSGSPTFIVGAGSSNTARKNIIEAYSTEVKVNGKLTTKDLVCSGALIGLGSNNTISSGTYALGAGLKQTNAIGSQVIVGVFNKETVKDATYGTPVFTVGKGLADNNRSNAIEVYRNLTKIKNDITFAGNASFAGDVSFSKNITANELYFDDESYISKSRLWALNDYTIGLGEAHYKFNTSGKFVVDGVTAGPGCISIENCAGYIDHKTTITNTELKIDKGVDESGNHDSVTLNSNELVFKKQEGTDTGVFKPGYAYLHGDHSQSIELTTDYTYNGITSRPACILEDRSIYPDIGWGTMVLTPTCIKMTECTSIDEYDSVVLETVKIDVSYLKGLEKRLSELESQSSNQDQESVRLKIKGTNEYCTVTAEKDSNGNITLSVENA